MFKSYPILSRFLVFVFIPLLAITTGAYIYLRRSLPVADGRSIKASVVQPVTITRDEHGVVIINAKTDRDAFFAIGYAQAQDRLWQLELNRRIAEGRLSEIFGHTTVSQDALMRALDLYGAAEASWSRLSPEAQASLSAYAAGVNAWIRQNPVLPPEFLALGVKPDPWREVDSLAWAKVFALNLGNNMWTEISNLIASQSLRKEQMVDLLGYSQADLLSNDKVTNAAKGETLAELLQFQRKMEDIKIGGPYVGSNAWVVSGRFTQDGRAILANDPHLRLQIPSPWYVAHLKGEKLNVSGMTLVGLPVVIFGQNGEIAWGGTSMMADVQDLYIEQPNPEDPTQYKHNGAWVPFQTTSQTINIRADFPASFRAPVESVKLGIRKTLDGPVISDVIGAFDQPVALRWTALDGDDLSYESFLRVNYAHDWSSFKDAFKTYVAPALNMLYADKSNNIGSLGVGRIPIRSKGKGRVPVSGSTNEYTWTGYIPFEAWPQRFNPDQGYIISANDNPVDANYRYFISADWAPPSRAQRIQQLLQDKISRSELISIDYIERMQGDTVDLSVRNLLEFLKQVPANGPEQQKALKYLSTWNGDMARDSQAAAIFFVWMRYLREELFSTAAKNYWDKPREADEIKKIASSTSYDQILNALTRSASNWCGNEVAATPGPCSTLLSDSLNRAMRELKKLRGSNMDSWRWGDVHETLYAHTPFSNQKFVAHIFERRISSGGSPNTINAANAVYSESTGYEQNFSAAFRQIIQIKDSSVYHLYMNSTGQSGNVLGNHYDDMIKPFRDVQYFVLDDSKAANRIDLTIIPE
ncbi:MAG TPA: penicillin acylase family protein [Pyrinomonadaceae bacterium]|nr:penicillin acylase family protein [Pyrinomonadaceae bacterium]